MDDTCEKCLLAANCSNACIDLMMYYNYLSKTTRANLESIPGVNKNHLEEFEKLETRGHMLVKWWKRTEGISD
jgi:hypothetical protein